MPTPFSAQIQQWYATEGRQLPWRDTRDPYRIWLSEIILQQTRTSQGLSYYERFLRAFPDVGALAAASEQEVMRLWQGLGYYSRARNLHAAARQIAERGAFPVSYADVLALPGVGEYTAAAICSFAYDAPCAVVDGNVYRVLARHFGIDTPIDSTHGRRLFAQLADEMLDRRHPATHNQALMDFGALVCKPAAPQCVTCPLSATCLSLEQHRVSERPVKARRPTVRDRYFIYVYVRREDGHILLHRRSRRDIWQGLYEFPLVETVAPAKSSRSILSLLADLPLPRPSSLLFPSSSFLQEGASLRLVVQGFVHQLTHQRIHADLYELTLQREESLRDGWQASSAVQPAAEYFWIAEQDLHLYPLPQLLHKMLEIAFSSPSSSSSSSIVS